MKRSMAGGAHRGPVEIRRQRRTVRFVQGLLVVIGASLLIFAGYSMGEAKAVRSGDLAPPRDPGAAQTIVLTLLGLGTFGVALGLQGSGGVRLPTPHRLRDFERAAGQKRSALERAAGQKRSALERAAGQKRTLDDGPVPVDPDDRDQAPAGTRAEHTP